MKEKKKQSTKKTSKIVDMKKALSEKSAKEFTRSIETGQLYKDLKPKKNKQTK